MNQGWAEGLIYSLPWVLRVGIHYQCQDQPYRISGTWSDGTSYKVVAVRCGIRLAIPKRRYNKTGGHDASRVTEYEKKGDVQEEEEDIWEMDEEGESQREKATDSSF